VRCPSCQHEESKVTDSRSGSEMNCIRRRRECLKCGFRFTTFETVDLTIQVKKRNGTFEDFSQEKLVRGIDTACHHSRVSHDQVRGIASKITAELMARNIREISAQELGEIVMEELKIIDPIAYIRFACVYKRLKHIDELRATLEAIVPKDASDEEKKAGVICH
jgi:transcriptional repressor NrdR